MKTSSEYCCALLLSGCEHGSREGIIWIRARKTGESVTFDSGDLRGRCPDGVFVQDIFVTKRDCSERCEYWGSVRRTRIEDPEELLRLPIRYGLEISDGDSRVPARELADGVYSFGATVGCPARGGTFSAILGGRFEVMGKGSMVADRSSEPAPGSEGAELELGPDGPLRGPRVK